MGRKGSVAAYKRTLADRSRDEGSSSYRDVLLPRESGERRALREVSETRMSCDLKKHSVPKLVAVVKTCLELAFDQLTTLLLG
jgi:hypothetical protein